MRYNRVLIEELRKVFDERKKYLAMNTPKEYEVRLGEVKVLWGIIKDKLR